MAYPISGLQECWVSVPLLLQSIGTPKAQLSGDLLMANLRVPMMRIPRASLTGIESPGVNKGKCYDWIESMLLAFDKEKCFSCQRPSTTIELSFVRRMGKIFDSHESFAGHKVAKITIVYADLSISGKFLVVFVHANMNPTWPVEHPSNSLETSASIFTYIDRKNARPLW